MPITKHSLGFLLAADQPRCSWNRKLHLPWQQEWRVILDLCICPKQSVSFSSWWNYWKIWAPHLTCLVLSLSLLIFSESSGLLTFDYLSTCPPPSAALEDAHNGLGLLFLFTLGLKKQSSTSWQPTPVFDLEQLASECGFLPPSPPVTSSLLSTSHLLSKIFSYFVFPELFIMQARRTISLLEK